MVDEFNQQANQQPGGMGDAPQNGDNKSSTNTILIVVVVIIIIVLGIILFASGGEDEVMLDENDDTQLEEGAGDADPETDDGSSVETEVEVQQ